MVKIKILALEFSPVPKLIPENDFFFADFESILKQNVYPSPTDQLVSGIKSSFVKCSINKNGVLRYNKYNRVYEEKFS